MADNIGGLGQQVGWTGLIASCSSGALEQQLAVPSVRDIDSLDLTDPKTFRHWHRITIRSADEDPMGHVNNTIYTVWIEVARVLLIKPYLEASPDWMNTVLASMSVDFLNETHFPGDIDVGVSLAGIGNRSLTSVYGVFRDGQCLATSRCVNVYFDTRSRRSTAPTDAMRDIMQRDLASPPT